MLKDSQTKRSERHGWQGRVQRPNEIFVEPLRFFDLEADSRDRREIFLGEVDDEADAKIVQPWSELALFGSRCMLEPRLLVAHNLRAAYVGPC